ncbi:hypothetical protein G6F56_010360 [Rhizopus delemar]|nr:hypothetical protein G6F56_010360 [Rhizopus delemar]
MVGLPARGKTYIAYKICRYLNWLGIKTEIFSVGNYRRKIAGLHPPPTFFDINNEDGMKKRHEAAEIALKDMINWYTEKDGIAAIFDATNSTKADRAWINEELTKSNIQVLFIESICDVPSIIMSNIKEVKLSSPDYENLDPEEATQDYMKRIGRYEAFYETITENDLTYMKLVNMGSQYIINIIRGYLETE